MNKSFIHMLLLILLAIVSADTKAITFPASYQATYAVSRDGKTMAEQTTTFKQVSPKQYTLIDVTKGTHGLASFTGFKRIETSRFQLNHDQILAIDHDMQQKVAFKSKSYQFKLLTNESRIKGHSKQAFTLETAIKPISSHMLPLWLSAEVCGGKIQPSKHISIPVLKSKHIKIYEFSVFNESPELFRIERIYPENAQRSTQIWLNKSQNCLPIKTRHQEADEPVIETNLVTHRLIKNT